jgi:hypothetical protein
MKFPTPIEGIRRVVDRPVEGVHPSNGRRTRGLLIVLVCLSMGIFGTAWAEEGGAGQPCIRYELPQAVLDKPFYFAGELVPIQRIDVRNRIREQVNFLLLDARGVLTDWLTERTRHVWIFDEIFEKEGVPKEFTLFSPVIAGLARSGSRTSPTGWWALDKPCSGSEGVDMSEDAWRDDRYDFELATRCFATRIKRIRSELQDSGWLMSAAAYVTSVKAMQDLMQQWNTRSYWDLPLPDPAGDLVVRWIAFGIISTHRQSFDLRLKEVPPLVFDQITSLTFAKDLSVAQLADMAGVSSREILQMNPKLKPGAGTFPAKDNGKAIVHAIAVPKGKGWMVVNKLKEGGYVTSSGK